MSDLSPKVSSAALGGAVATLIWTVASSATNVFSDQAISALTGSTATILTFVFGYLVSDPKRGSGDGPTARET